MALNGRLDVQFGATAMGIQCGLPFVLRFPPHDLLVRNSKHLTHERIKSPCRLWAFHVFRFGLHAPIIYQFGS